MIDEKDVMLLVKAGQLDKLAILFENNKVKLFNYFRKKGNNAALSEDLVQETFMKILAYRTSFNATSTFSGWMYGIARNTAADFYRKNKGNVVHENIDEHEVLSEHCQTEVAVTRQQQEMFDQSLANISAEHREIIILSRFQQLNYQQISTLLDCNLNTLKSKMRNAINKLHEQYSKLSGEVEL
jgi:RNA polymerase sigma-70 factor (ECF subfamily)